MKKLIKDLTSISKALSALAEKVEQMADALEKEAAQAKPVKKTAAKKKAAPKTTKKAPSKKKSAAKKKAPKKTAPKVAEPTEVSEQSTEQPSDTGSLIDNIYGLISTEGTTVAEIKEKTGFKPRQVSNALYKLTQKGLIDTVSRGVYVKKES
ncbi:hypothetical protein DSCO28_73630 (plasmid) [Desulfosarcina ovata subsp. sediminis]|uniref:Replication protein A C-terminal domain-containing protein n=1 Tax=Desulfosarcina ovata subsp. sediminis TaxID=885957 RepID=A0A5K8A2S7_9BACT|nr:hypothetical protein [Desulfosarcina ovata]BBO86797.1 hypothetical protein DSCO28_73630 [Desulfosarcina ovata subsp. sediminis]